MNRCNELHRIGGDGSAGVAGDLVNATPSAWFVMTVTVCAVGLRTTTSSFPRPVTSATRTAPPHANRRIKGHCERAVAISCHHRNRIRVIGGVLTDAGYDVCLPSPSRSASVIPVRSDPGIGIVVAAK